MAKAPAFTKGDVVTALEDYTFTNPVGRKFVMKKGDTFEITFSNASTCMVRPSMGGFTKAVLFALAESDAVVTPRSTIEEPEVEIPTCPVTIPTPVVTVPPSQIAATPTPTSTITTVKPNEIAPRMPAPEAVLKGPFTGPDNMPVSLSRRELAILYADASKASPEAVAIYKRLLPPMPPVFGEVALRDNFKYAGKVYMKINKTQALVETMNGMNVSDFASDVKVELVKEAQITFVSSRTPTPVAFGYGGFYCLEGF